MDQVTQYSSLPFQTSDIVEIYPVIKHLELQNNDVRQMILQAKQTYKDGMFEKAFELYSASINSLMQITGPMNKEVASCIAKLASI
jgi:protein TIF31